jgi:polyketide cyclase/dehydrase/lipid transport protein
MNRIVRIVLMLIVLFLVFVNSRPSTFHVERSATIAAPADSLFPRIANFHAWNDWSPWAKLDPKMKQEFGGADAAVGSSYSWSSAVNNVGEGRMTLTDAQPSSRIAIKLDFLKPFKSTSTATFNLTPEGAGTKVTWSMDGPMNFMSKFMCLFMSMDKMVGGDFEKGLASLKQLNETAPAAH